MTFIFSLRCIGNNYSVRESNLALFSFAPDNCISIDTKFNGYELRIFINLCHQTAI